VSKRLKQRLIAKGPYKVLLTRETDQTVSLAQRVEFAKSNKADLFISVHVNSLPNESVNLIETFYFGPPLTSEILHLAEQENKGSHFTIGELNEIVQDIGNTLKRQESAMLAASIQESLFMNVRNHDDQVLDVGIKMAPFVVLSRIDVPSVLVEISCLTKEEEEIKLASAEYREKIASYIEEGIIRYLKNSTPPKWLKEKFNE
jgi:N-acetylmuramoyl-L-alanine amidase